MILLLFPYFILKKPIYDKNTERRILAVLDTDPPVGYSSWTGTLLVRQLGDVSANHVWRVLRHHGIYLQRHHSWCVSTDPEFTRKEADIVGLYLNPSENAVVISVDEKPAIQALERAQGWLRLPNGQALRGFSHEYKRHSTTTLFAALEMATGMVTKQGITAIAVVPHEERLIQRFHKGIILQ